MASRDDNGNGYGRDAYAIANAAMEQTERNQADLVRHERDCFNRYGEIKQAQAEAKAERKEMHQENQRSIEKLARDTKAEVSYMSGRVDRLYNRAWAIAATIIGAEAAIIAWFMTEKLRGP